MSDNELTPSEVEADLQASLSRQTLLFEANAAAEDYYPALNPDAEELTYPRSALRGFNRAAFVEGATWAADRIDALEAEVARLRDQQAHAWSEGWMDRARRDKVAGHEPVEAPQRLNPYKGAAK
jgi:hypothetical protein